MDEKQIIELIDCDKIYIISFADLSKYNEKLIDIYMSSKSSYESAKIVIRINKINKYLNELHKEEFKKKIINNV